MTEFRNLKARRSNYAYRNIIVGHRSKWLGKLASIDGAKSLTYIFVGFMRKRLDRVHTKFQTAGGEALKSQIFHAEHPKIVKS